MTGGVLFVLFRSCCFHHHRFFAILLANGLVEVLRNFYFADVGRTVLCSEFLDGLQVMSDLGCLLDDGVVGLRAGAASNTSLLTAATGNLVLKEFR